MAAPSRERSYTAPLSFYGIDGGPSVEGRD